MAIYEVTITSKFATQLSVNRFNYVGSGVGATEFGSFGLAVALGAVYDPNVQPPAYPPPPALMRRLAACSSVQVQFEELTVVNIYDFEDFYSAPFVPAYTGTRSGESMSPTSALGFRTNVIRRDVGRGYKRFVGLTEPDVVSQGQINPAYLAAEVQELAVAMSANLTYTNAGNNLTYVPAVAGKERYNPATQLASPTGTAYRYFPTEVVQMQHMAESVIWSPYTTVRTQTSRQYGRGR